MSPEDRAKELLLECRHNADEGPCTACLVATIRSAENDALERAAALIDTVADTYRKSAFNHHDARSVLELSAVGQAFDIVGARIRSLKSTGGGR